MFVQRRDQRRTPAAAAAAAAAAGRHQWLKGAVALWQRVSAEQGLLAPAGRASAAGARKKGRVVRMARSLLPRTLGLRLATKQLEIHSHEILMHSQGAAVSVALAGVAHTLTHLVWRLR